MKTITISIPDDAMPFIDYDNLLLQNISPMELLGALKVATLQAETIVCLKLTEALQDGKNSDPDCNCGVALPCSQHCAGHNA